jgi:hypothetical protein
MNALFQMLEEDPLIRKKRTFEWLRKSFLVGLVGTILTCIIGGVASLESLMWTLPVALVWLVTLVMSWRSEESVGWELLAFILLPVGSRLAGIHQDDVSMIHFLQWLFLWLLLTSAPLWFRRASMYQLARLDRAHN